MKPPRPSCVRIDEFSSPDPSGAERRATGGGSHALVRAGLLAVPADELRVEPSLADSALDLRLGAGTCSCIQVGLR